MKMWAYVCGAPRAKSVWGDISRRTSGRIHPPGKTREDFCCRGKEENKGENGMKRFFLICSPIFVLVSAMLLCGTSIHAAMETTVEEIVADKDSYDGKEVSLSGAVSTPRFKASRHRKPYITFPLLGDSGSRINILFWGDIKLKTGKKIKVHGVYRKMMEIGKYTFRDMIEASEIETEMKIQEKNP
jgi:hypothetical protein